MKNLFILAFALCLLLASFYAGIVYISNTNAPKIVGFGQSSIIPTLTQTSYLASTTPLLISAGDKQGYRAIANVGGATGYLFFNSTTTGITSSTATNGIPVAAGGIYQITSQNYITGQIYAILPSGTTTFSVAQ